MFTGILPIDAPSPKYFRKQPIEIWKAELMMYI